jgi:plasmid stabilization system protein ParE
MARVVWTRRALNHLSEIVTYTAEHFSPAQAEKLVARIDRAVQQIGDMPGIGSIVVEFQRENLREQLVKPFRIIYVVDADVVSIVSVVHHGRDLPGVIDPEELGI